MTMNLDKLIKLLRMTEGQHDGEVLNAIRMANAMLMQNNVNWREVLEGKVPMTRGEEKEEKRSYSRQNGKPEFKEKFVKYDDKDEINGYFNVLSRRPLGSFANFVKSVFESWETRGYLTEKQYEAIKRAAQKKPDREERKGF